MGRNQGGIGGVRLPCGHGGGFEKRDHRGDNVSKVQGAPLSRDGREGGLGRRSGAAPGLWKDCGERVNLPKSAGRRWLGRACLRLKSRRAPRMLMLCTHRPQPKRPNSNTRCPHSLHFFAPSQQSAPVPVPVPAPLLLLLLNQAPLLRAATRAPSTLDSTAAAAVAVTMRHPDAPANLASQDQQASATAASSAPLHTTHHTTQRPR